MENFILDELMDLAEAYVGPMIDAIYRRLMDRDFALEDPEVVMLLTALINMWKRLFEDCSKSRARRLSG